MTTTSLMTRTVHRLRGGDPVLRGLLVATLVSTVGRGMFFTLSVIFFTRVVGLSALSVGAGLTAAGAVGVVASFAGGYLADAFGAKRLMIVGTAVMGAGLVGYAFVGGLVWYVVVACIVVGSQNAASSARSALLARAFEGPKRVGARASMRVVTNIGIGLGTAVAGVALVIDDESFYRGALVVGGVTYLASLVWLVRLPYVDPATAPRVVGERAPGRSPLRDRRYLAITVLGAVTTMQFGLFEVGVPVWVSQHTAAPTAIVSVLLLMNTAIVIALQIPLSRGTRDVGGAGRASLVGGALMVVACALWAAAAIGQPVIAVVVLLAAAASHSLAEVYLAAGGWGLGFELADPERAGAYQGVYGTGAAIGAMLAPVVVTQTAIGLGSPGWVLLASMFFAAALGLWIVARRASRVGAAP
ncbi:MFS transporter [Frigoribacterium sp. 2-23]|uniref:MFS transporter n=1 Tax=Frigoribacterium sp. 2-23 TaxID=3415006 RepID=UPI003C6EE662